MKNILACGVVILLGVTSTYGQKFQLFGVDSTMRHSKGNVHYHSTLEHYTSENNDKPISVTQLNTEASKYVFNRLSVSGNVMIAFMRGSRIIAFQERRAHTVGAGFSGWVRWEVANFDHHNFFIEVGHGMLFTLREFPPGGTKWNFSIRRGFGFNVHLKDNRYLTFGWRWMHLSNGRGFIPENPAYEGNGLYIGFKFAKQP